MKAALRLTLLLVLAVPGFFATPVVADPTRICTSGSETFLKNLDTQFARNLAHRSPEVRTMAIGQVIEFARACGSRIEFKAVVPHLAEIYDHPADPEQRDLAITALEAIGNAHTLRQLREVAGRDATLVDRLNRALSERYSVKNGTF